MQQNPALLISILLFEIHQNISVVHILNKGNIIYIVRFLKNTVVTWQIF